MMNREAKIADLGLAQFMRTSGRVSGKSGAPFYQAHEVLFQEKYNHAADIWALGIVLLESLLRKTISELSMPPVVRADFL